MSVTAIVPAYNEACRIEDTVRAISTIEQVHDVLVVDDASSDDTAARARMAGARVLTLSRNGGKGQALMAGLAQTTSDILLLLDADLGLSAARAQSLLAPVQSGHADMTVARFPKRAHKGGFGLAKGLAVWGIARATGFVADAPLSGQRAVRREVLERVGRLAPGWGIEVALTIDTLRLGFRVQEVEVSFEHRVTGRDAAGFWHRGRQFADIGRALWPRLLRDRLR